MTERRCSWLLWLSLPYWVILALVGLADAAWSQQEEEAPAEVGNDAKPPTFYATATVQARPTSTATQTVSLVERSRIEALGARELGEALAFEPGVLVTGTGSRGGLTTAQIRGGDPNFTLVLVDGVPLNDATDQLGGAFNLAGLPTSGVERIEVVRGPVSAFYGSTGLAGAINVITRQGEAGKPLPGFEIEAGAASLRRVVGSFSGGRGSTDALIILSAEEEEGRIGEDRFEALHLLGNLGFKLGLATELRLRTRLASWQGDDYAEASGGPRFGSGELRRSEHEELSFAAELDTARTRHRRHRLAATVYRRELERRSPGIFPAVPPALEGTGFTDLRLSWVTTLHPAARSEPRGARKLTELSLGADVNRQRGTNESVLSLPPLLGGDLAGDYAIRRTTGSAFVELVASGRNLVFELGSRLDAPEDSGDQWSPRIGVGYRPRGGGVRLRSSVGRAFKLPSFFALATPRFLGGNPLLRPETSLSGDLGIELDAGESLDTGLTLFYNEYRELVDFDFDVFQLINRSRVKARGVELVVRWQGSSSLALDAQVTWQDVEDQATGATLLHRPRWSGGTRLRWRPRETLQLQLDARVLSGSLDQQIPVPERGSIGGYQLLGVAGSWRFHNRLELRMRLENLTGKDYETRVGFPGAERSVRLGLRYGVR